MRDDLSDAAQGVYFAPQGVSLAGGCRMVSFIRAAALSDFSEIARSAGVDPLLLCRAVGIPPSALSDRDEKIRSDAVGVLLDLAARQSGVEDFALRMAERRRPSSWGVTGLLMAQQKTLGEA